MTDQSALVEVACRDDSSRVRMAALGRIQGDPDLGEVAIKASELDVRLAAVERISSQRLLADIIKTRKNFELMGVCFSRITDRNVLQSIAEDPGYNPTARKIAVEQFADESYLSDLVPDHEEKEPESGGEVALEGLLDKYGGIRVVRAIGRFRYSEKALRALGKVARKGGESGELAFDYLCRALGSSNTSVKERAINELSMLSEPKLVSCLIRALDDPGLNEPIKEVLLRIGTPEAISALGEKTG